MDQQLIRLRKNEKKEGLQDRYRWAYEAISRKDLEGLFNAGYINSLSSNNGCERNFKEIGEIAPSEDRPERQRLSRENGFHSIISFSEFLLQVLWIKLYDIKEEIQTEVFFDVNKLQETFRKYQNRINADDFIVSLLKYRLLFDYYIVNITNESVNYELSMVSDSKTDKYGNPYKEVLTKFESMLYVNSSSRTYYFWIPELLKYVEEKPRSCQELYLFLKNNDELRHPISSIEPVSNLSFKNVDRYWFWRLDFAIWQKRNEFFQEEDARSVAKNYVFRRTRSIEHIAPQTPEDNSTLRLSEEEEHCFGNLVMISSSQNSGLQNSTFEMKRSKVMDYVRRNLSGTIESLKMLLVYQEQTWDSEVIEKHQKYCLSILRNSYEVSKE